MGPSYHAFVFTWNNYTPESLASFEKWYKAKCSFCAYAFEIAPTTGTPHLQGCFWLIKKQQVANIAKAKDLEGIAPQVQYGNMESQHKYIVLGLKDGEVKEHASGTVSVVWGEWPTEDEYEDQRPKQGERTDLRLAMRTVKEGTTKRKFIEEHTEVFAKYPRFCETIFNHAAEDRHYARLKS